ncbi:hypothetical protein MHBO_002669 [Bonamia ostreae]|uniref:PHD-type domain-containing protein n=1 Tax=Bonamia ostreae TaxID=126728 RepID=A0ABV2AN36_9EUKA
MFENGCTTGKTRNKDLEKRCAICLSEIECPSLLECRKCRVELHKQCLVLAKFDCKVGRNGHFDKFVCSNCDSKNIFTPKCVVCPISTGFFIRCEENRFIHLSCALWIPEIHIANKINRKVVGINDVPFERYQLLCFYCKNSYGACIQCASPNCSISFHPSCSFRNKNRFIIKDKNFQIWSNTDFGSEILAEKFLAFCHKHNNENVLNVEKQTDFLFFRRTINYRESPNSSNSRTFIANKKKLEKPKIFLPLIWKNLESFFDNRLIIPILRLLNCSPKIDLSFAIPGQPLRRSVKMRILENFVKMPSFLGYREKMAIGISTDLSFCRIFRFLENFFCKSNSSIDEKKCVCEQCRNLNDSFADFINDFDEFEVCEKKKKKWAFSC